MFPLTRKNYFWLVLIVISFLTSVVVRYDFVGSHFSHYDDILVTKIIQEGYIPNIPSALDFATKVGKWTTYAPLQYLLTGLLIEYNMSYEQMLFWTRLPSTIASILSMIVLFVLMKRIYGSNFLKYAVFPLIILGFSWESIIYAAQSESYAIGVLVALILFYLYFKLAVNITKLTKLSIISGLTIGLILFSQYQILLFLPGFFVALFFRGLIIEKQLTFKESIIGLIRSVLKNLLPFAKKYYLLFILVFVSFYYLYVNFLGVKMGKGLNWNVGPNKEFIFNPESLKDGVNGIFYFLKFIVANGLIVFDSIVSNGLESSALNKLYVGLVLLISCIGMWSFFKSNNSSKKGFLLLFLITIFAWGLLVLLGKQALSPTRHSLILLSFVLVFSAEGVYLIDSKIGSKKLYANSVLSFLLILSVSSFVKDYSAMRLLRVDKFQTEEKMLDLVEKNDVSSIYECGWTLNMQIMNFVKTDFLVEQDGDMWRHYQRNADPEGNILLISKNDLSLKTMVNEYEDFVLNGDSLNYELIGSRKDIGTAEIDYSSRTKNGGNTIVYYILKVN